MGTAAEAGARRPLGVVLAEPRPRRDHRAQAAAPADPPDDWTLLTEAAGTDAESPPS